jgi:zinc protease
MPPKRQILWLILLSLTVCHAQQRPRKPVTGRSAPAYMKSLKSFSETQYVTKAVLRNGMTVLVNEFRPMPVVAITTYIGAGRFDEPDSVAGISQVMGRMFYKETGSRAPGPVLRDIAALGGKVEITNGYDNSLYTITVPSSQWKKALEIHADSLVNMKLDPAELEREIDYIINMGDLEFRPPAEVPQQALYGLAFQQHRIRKPLSPDERILRTLDRDALLKHYNAYYHPSRVILCISGDVTASDIFADVVKLYDKQGTAGAKPEASGPAEPAQEGFRYREISGGTQLSRVLLGFHAVPATSPEFPAVEVLRAIIGLGEGSVLSQNLKHRKKLISRVEARLLDTSEVGYLTIELQLDPRNLDKAELAALTEIEILKRSEVEDEDLQRALAQLEREHWAGLQTVQSRTHNLAVSQARGDWRKMNETLARLRKVGVSDVRKAAARYLTLENCSLLEYLPAAAEPRNLQTDALRKSFEQLLDASATQEMAERETETKPAYEVPGPGSFQFSEVRYSFRKASVLRGPELFVREDHTLPLIHLGFFYPGGKLFEKKENNGITTLMLRSMLRGPAKKDPLQLYKQLDLYGAEISPVVEDDYSGFRMSVLSRNITPALDLLGQMVQSPELEDADIEREMELQLQEIRGRKSRPLEYVSQVFDQVLFKEHPYGLTAAGEEGAVAGLKPDAVRQWYGEYIRRRRPVIIIVGDTQGTSLAGYFVKRFSGSRFQDVALPQEFVAAPEASAAFEDSLSADRSIVALGFQAPPQDDDESWTVEVLQSLLAGGRFGTRPPDEVSEVSVEYEPRLRAGSIMAFAVTSPANEEKALKLLEQEMLSIIETPLSYKDYRSSVSFSSGRHTIHQQSRFAEIDMLMRNFLAGSGIEGLSDHTMRLQEVTQEDLPEAARRIFNMEKRVTVRLHGRS